MSTGTASIRNQGKDSREETVDRRFRVLYAIAIVLVVAQHVTDNGSLSFFFEWIPNQGVNICLFLFASGYFYKEASEKALLPYLWKKVKRLLIPLYLYNLAYGVLVWVLRPFGFTIGGEFNLKNLLLMPLTDGHQFLYNLGGWFLAPLFMAEVVYVLEGWFLRRIVLKKLPVAAREWIIFSLNLLVGIGGAALSIRGHCEGWWLPLVRLCIFLPFYSLGYLYKARLEKWDRIPDLWYFAGIFAGELLLLVYCHRIPFYVFSWCESFPEGPVVPFISVFLGIAFWWRIARLLTPGLGKGKYVNLIATHTFSIMMNQFLGFMALKGVYALASRFLGLFADFDHQAFCTDIWYYYTPPAMPYYGLILYVAAGIALPLLLSALGEKLSGTVRDAGIDRNCER